MITVFLIGYIFDDDLVEVTITFAAAYLTFYVAEDVCHVSGVLALVALGLCVASFGKSRISPNSEHSVHTWWRILTYHGNTLIFLFVGVSMVLDNDFSVIAGRDWGMVIVLWAFLYVIRAAMLVLVSPLMRCTGYPLRLKEAVLIVHGGLRGAVSLALALVVSLDRVGATFLTRRGARQNPLLCRRRGCLDAVDQCHDDAFLLNKLGLTKEPAGERVYEGVSEPPRVYPSTKQTN